MQKRFLWLLIVGGCPTWVVLADTTKDDKVDQAPPAKTPLAHHYGFLPPEIYKLDFRIQNLLIRDVNGDGRGDIVVVNNLKNRIDVLEQRDPSKPPEEPNPEEINELVHDWRLEHRKIPTARTIGALEIKDVDGDDRPDLVYLGTPPGLYIEYQDEDGKFRRSRRFEVKDALTSAWSLDIGDLTGDGKDEIVFLGKKYLYVVAGTEDGRIEQPKRYRLSGGRASIIRILDFDEDGQNDIVYLTDDKEFPVRVRFRGTSGQLGPERRLHIDKPLGVSYANLDGKPGLEMLDISSLKDQLLIHTLDFESTDDDSPLTQLVSYPFEKTGSNLQTDLVVADFDGDGRVDVVVSDSDAARLFLYRQSKAEGLDRSDSFPGMVGTTLLRAIDLQGDGKSDLISLSDQEKSIALSRFDGNRLTFPQSLPTKDEPIVFEVLGNRIVYLARVDGKTSSSDQFVLRMLEPSKPKAKSQKPKAKKRPISWTVVDLGNEREKNLWIELKGQPYDLRALDANGDGHADLMFFLLFQPPVLWLSDEKGSFQEAPKLSQSVLGNLEPAAMFSGKLAEDQPVLLFAQGNFARSMQMNSAKRWKVLDQYNAPGGSSRVTGVAAIDLQKDGSSEIVLYDRSSSSIVVLKMKDGLYRRWHQLKVGAMDLEGIRVADFDGNGSSDLLLFDSEQMGIIYVGRKESKLQQIASYETDIRGGRLTDMVPGDLNSDGKLDILLLEPSKHHLEILAVLPNTQLKRTLRWKVFEEKTYRRGITSRIGIGFDPREAVIGDVDSDGRNDIVLLTHDRVLVYLQDDGTENGDQ